MAPTPQEFAAREQDEFVGTGEGVVISGMSGLYPNARNVSELSDILYNKENPISADHGRWKYDHPEVAQYLGKLSGLEKFDAQFFKVHFRLGNSMDSMSRKILEQAYQAIYDAGVSPEQLSGRKIGVYIGTCFSETEKACFYVASSRTGFGIAGCSKTMFANRISYWLNAKGPSMSVDDACCSSTAAVELAYQAIVRGDCEGAIVGGANLSLHPQSSIHYSRIMKLSKDGKTRSFDEEAAGCARSEAINVLFLQKAKDARRVYAEIVHVKTEFTTILEGESGPRYGFYRDHQSITNFLKAFYDETRVPTQAIEYVEAVGSAVPEVDKVELEALSEVLCKDRDQPLMIGSVMSNIGYAEAASGINAITKVLLGYHTGVLAGNLYCETPRRDVKALCDGRMRVLQDHAPFRRSYAAVNGLSVTGVNAHVLLHGHYKPKDLLRYKCNIPHLVTVSARQESSVINIFKDLKSHPIDPEQLALLHNIHNTRISGHLGRGFIVLDTNEENKTVSLCEKAEYFDDIKRPLWFVYSGMGSQWTGMGIHLMRIPVFAAAIERCRRVLEPKGVDIVHIITSQDKTIFDNILNSFVGIAAIQIGLTDILREIGLVPDKIIGHSVGELGCAYADGCFTAEEMILSAYSRGLVSIQTPFIRGSMAAVGIGYQQIIKMCPPEIEVACHNGPDSCTISGPANVMREFVTQLTAKKIFAKEVPCSDIAYHSRYIAEAGPGLLKYLSEVIKSPKPRSDRWISTSVPVESWDKESAKYSSAEYHTNNLLSPVLFEESSRLIPSDAVLVEVAPHGLLQAILKRSLPDSCRNIPLTRRGHPDNARLVLEAIGQLYMLGYYPRVQELYPKVEFPVSTGTPMLSHLVEWAHHEDWNLPLYASAHRRTTASTKFVLSIHDEEHSYLQGNVIKGKMLYPYAATLMAVWDTLAMTRGVARRGLSVQFRDVTLHSQPVLHERRQLRLAIALHRATGRFEVMDEQSKVASGFILSDLDVNRTTPVKYEGKDELDQNTIYQMLYMRDYSYRGAFRSIHSANNSFSEARILWQENWVTLIDAMLQINVLRQPHETVSQPEFIRKIRIDIEEHEKEGQVRIGDEPYKIVNVSQNMTRCEGVIIEDVRLHNLPVTSEGSNVIDLRTLKYVPHFPFEKSDIDTAIHVYLQIVSENINKNNINVLKINDNENETLKHHDIEHIVGVVPGIKSSYKYLKREKILDERDNFTNDVDLLLVSNLSVDDHLCQTLYRVLPRDTFVVNKETQASATIRPTGLYEVLCSHKVDLGNLELLRWQPTSVPAPTCAISVHSPSDLDLLSATQASLLPRQKLLVLTSYPPISGLKDLIKQWRKENDRKICVAMINHKISEDQSLDQMPNLELAFNILDHGKWGGEYYVPLRQKSSNEEVTLRCTNVGDLNSLYWTQIPLSMKSKIKVKVHYAGINDLDVKRATGIISFDSAQENGEGFGMDFSGVTETGERVMGIVPQGAVSSSLDVSAYQLWPVPTHWSLEDAATVPLAYCLAYYCLGLRSEVQTGMRVLVHGGAGALGQAVISVALAHHCDVFATVGSVAKKRFLQKVFPTLKAKNIGNSRDLTFGDMVMNVTKGEGVDIVISCVVGELKNVSLKCGGRTSYIFDVVQIHSRENYDFGMSSMSKERGYIRVDLSNIFKNEHIENLKKLQRMIGEGVARGWVRPLSRVTYSPHAAPNAFRLIASTNQRGRVLLNLHAARETLAAKPRIQCSSNLYHVILSDNDLLTIQLIDKLISRGVRKLLLQRFRPYLSLDYKLRQWRQMGVEVTDGSKNIFNLSNESNVLTSIEGIYLILSENDKPTEYTTILADLDTVSKQATALKYFGVISTDYSIGSQICISRAQNRLPATMIQLPPIRKMGDTSIPKPEEISPRQAVDAIEQGLCSSEAIIFARVNVSPKPSLLSRLATIAEITIPEDVQSTATLSELGMNVAKTNAVHVFLRDICNTSISEEALPNIAIRTLHDIEQSLSEEDFKDVDGLKAFFSYVDSDELLATTDMVFLPTLTSGTTMRGDEFDVSQTHLCVVPGLEGHHARFRTLCERLKLPALVLQPGLDRPHETVPELANRYAQILIQKAGLKSNFYLLGYESGVLVALEVASILEDHGYSGTVFCIGSSPEEFKDEFKQRLSGIDSEEALQDAVLRHMVTLMTGGDCAELSGLLEGTKSWAEKVEAAVRALLGRVSHSAQYARQLIEAAHGRTTQLLRYECVVRALRSRLVLLRPASPRAALTPPAASLQPHSLQPVSVHELRAPLPLATEDLRCSAIVNSYLGDEILKAFETKNLCESYLLNAESFMTNLKTNET